MVSAAFTVDEVHFFPKGRYSKMNIRMAEGAWLIRDLYSLEAFGTFISY